MKAIDIRSHFLSQAPWVDPEKTVDRVIIGDPYRDVRRILVTWISSFQAIRKAVAGRYDLLMTHEPTFWVHENELPQADASAIGSEKRRFVERAGLVILRNHDVWDRMPEVGIPWAWAQYLGITTPPVAFGCDNYQHRYDIAPTTLETFARGMAERTAAIGESAVQVIGDPAATVSKIGIGTGCACRIPVFQEMGCDLAIVCDDGSIYWRDIQRAADQGFAVIRVNHGTSEEPGMRTLTRYINQHLPAVSADHLPHGSCFCLVTPTSG